MMSTAATRVGDSSVSASSAAASDRKMKASKSDKSKDPFVFVDSALLESTMTNLNTLRKNKQFCDVVLEVGSHELHAHRAVLACTSHYFFELFCDTNKPSDGHYLLEGFDFSAFEKLLNYAYTGRLEVAADDVKTVYKTARKLRMKPAHFACSNFLAENLDPNNCIGTRAIANRHSDISLIEKTDNFIQDNIMEIAVKKEFLDLQRIQLEVVQCGDGEQCISIQENHTMLCEMALIWLRNCMEVLDINIDSLTEKVHMLRADSDGGLSDCVDRDDDDLKHSEIVQEYKKKSKKHMKVLTPSKVYARLRHNSNGPVTARKSSSIHSEDDEEDHEWKVVAMSKTADHACIALYCLNGYLVRATIHEQATVSNSPTRSRSNSFTGDKYETMPIADMDQPRCGVGTCELSGKLFVCGGYDRGECMSSVDIYDPKDNTWSAAPPMLSPRGRFDITVFNGMVYAVGGSDGMRELSSTECYSPSDEKWVQATKLPASRSCAGVSHLHGKIYCIGGWSGQDGMKACHVYEPEQKAWTRIASMNERRSQAGVSKLNGKLYAVGGCDSWNCLNSAEVYDPASNTWSRISSMSHPRRGAGVVEFIGKLYAVGGSDGQHSLDTVDIYDDETDTWSAGPPLNIPRANVGVAVLQGKLYAVGGFTGKVFLDNMEVFDPFKEEWVMEIRRKTPRSPPVSESDEMAGSEKILKNSKHVIEPIDENGTMEEKENNASCHVNGSG